ncbi:pilin [Hydrogenophaga flava]|uniref:pilin n=1 Tax=Hydrogenophaga flava TaxID=65657 RepID=UPI000A0463EC|nr:pilin [Hydrogenophaga flava]
MKTRPNRHDGFTLIELMVVVAIIGIMATLAVPSYQDRIIRAQVKEALGLASFAQEGVQTFQRTHRQLPASNAEAGLPPADKIVGNYVVGVRVEAGATHLTFGNNANRNLAGKTLTLRPAIVKDHPQVPIAWVCGQAGVPAQMQAMGENRTDLPMEFLPIDCRPGPTGASPS